MKKLFGGVLAIVFMASCTSSSTEYKTYLSNPQLFSQVVHELNSVVMGNNFPPIVASRNYTYASIAAYEVMAAGNPTRFNSLAGQINDLTAMPKPQGDTINFELAAMLAFMQVGEAVTFPEGSMKDYRDSILQVARDKGLPKEEEKQSVAFADTVSKALIAWSKGDNYAKTRGAQKYTVMDVPGRWVPTPPMYADAAEPNWRMIRPLVMDSANQFTPPPPVPFNMDDKNGAYYKQVMAIYDSSKTMTKEEEHIAWFWDDNPFKLNVSGHVMFSTKKFSPPGHWMGIVGIAAQKAKVDFAETVYAYAITAIAKFDAFIQCWDEKYRSNYARPETVINKYIDPEWRPLLQTPAFPEYTCGHSTTSAAAAEALTKVFGDNFAYTDTTELEFGIESRSFTSFRQAAEENNLARFYGGIHFHPSCLVSTDYGKKVGELVVSKLHMKK
ncbi:MAG: vanadium-dependent haloperoxidase [Chitinophagaceae bacterium]|nr:vanadium-dependent haloperoxidase [Chitinophagaceae bacterium]